MKKSLTQIAFLNALGEVAYILLVALFMINTKALFGEVKEPSILIPVVMLLLFVISALISGLLILAKPITLFMGGAKKDAVTLTLYTLVFLVLFFILGAFGLIILG